MPYVITLDYVSIRRTRAYHVQWNLMHYEKWSNGNPPFHSSYEQMDRHGWKDYLSAASLACGKYMLKIPCTCIFFGKFATNNYHFKMPPCHFEYVNWNTGAAGNVKLIKCAYQDDYVPFFIHIPYKNNLILFDLLIQNHYMLRSWSSKRYLLFSKIFLHCYIVSIWKHVHIDYWFPTSIFCTVLAPRYSSWNDYNKALLVS